MKNFLIKTKNKLRTDKQTRVKFDIREHENVLLSLCIQLNELRQNYFSHH